jgi:proliferating cell nuclear antigen
MSETIQELEDTIQKAQEKIQELEAYERLAAFEDWRQEEESRGRRAEYTGERIAASVKEMVEDIPTTTPQYLTPAFTVDKTTLYHVITQASAVVDEVTVVMDSEGMRLRTMDPSHVCLIDIVLPAGVFEAFQTQIPETKFGLMLDEFVKVLRNFDKKDLIDVSIYDSMIHLRSASFSTSLRTVETSYSNPPLPKLTFNTELELSINTLKKLKGIKAVSEYIELEASTSVTARGKSDLGNAEMPIEAESSNIKEESKALYSLEFLLRIVNNITRDIKDNVTLQFSTKMPLQLSYRVREYGKIDFYLAPRVQD